MTLERFSESAVPSAALQGHTSQLEPLLTKGDTKSMTGSTSVVGGEDPAGETPKRSTMNRHPNALLEFEEELEELDRLKGTISYDLNAKTLDERLAPYREAKLYTMRYAMGEVWAKHWYMHRMLSARANQYVFWLPLYSPSIPSHSLLSLGMSHIFTHLNLSFQ